MMESSELEPVRIAVVGTGAIAQAYIPLLVDSPHVTLAAVCDVDRERVEGLARRLDVEAYVDHRAMLERVDLDGIIICVPPAYHMEIAIDALRAGVHVLCEKPLTIGTFAAKQMFGVARGAGRILTMASKFRFVGDIIRTREIVASGTIGRVVRAENVFASRVDMTKRWNSDVALSGGGVLVDNGTHSVDIMRFLLGPLASAYAVETSVDPRYDRCEDTTQLFVRTESGIAASIVLSWALDMSVPWFLRLYGTEGTIDVGWQSSSYRRFQEDAVVFGSGYDKRAAFQAQIDNFAGAIVGANDPAVGPQDAIASVEVIDAAYDSIRRSMWSQVEVRRLTPFDKLMSRPAVAAG